MFFDLAKTVILDKKIKMPSKPRTIKEEMPLYREAVKQFLSNYASIPVDSNLVMHEIIADVNNDRYCLMRYGLQEQQWHHNCVFHLNVFDGKVLVLQNWTELNIIQELELLGIAGKDIFFPILE